jgi:hypothetical protein
MTGIRDQMGTTVVAGFRGCFDLRMRGAFDKNVYFGFGDFMNRINALIVNRVYFCIPSRKRPPRKIKDLAENMSTFVYFCILSPPARGGFV